MPSTCIIIVYLFIYISLRKLKPDCIIQLVEQLCSVIGIVNRISIEIDLKLKFCAWLKN